MKKILFLLTVSLYFFLFYTQSIEVTDYSDKLYIEIYEYSKKVNEEPISAYCDSIYKLIPGYNGKALDVLKSYDAMNDVFDEGKLIYEYTKPNVNIYDLTCGPIYKGNENKKAVTLIINVAWGEEYIIDMLKILDKYNVYANFFIEGKWAGNNNTLVTLIDLKGHLIGNHSYSHKNFKLINKTLQQTEIISTNKVLESLINKDIEFFGPPSGSYSDLTIEVTNELNMKTIMWSLDTIDWQNPSKETILSRILPNLHNGAIILMHPTKNTLLSLETLIIEIQKLGYDIDKLDNFLSSNR